jgi:peptidoglycan/xylan/chitin deacetylase (PgdA/CDA1 family)
MTPRWGPDGKQAAVTFAFDNLGEASDIEFGRWPIDRPVGSHHSVMRDLPLILEALSGHVVAFFVESWNLHVYPDAIRAIADAGHEIGSHGLRHEIWCTLSPDQERDHMKRCVDDFARYGVEIKGLRPPGAIAASSSAHVLPELGLTYVSPVGVSTGVLDSGLAVLESVVAASDVAFYGEPFVKYRNYKPNNEILSPEDFVEGMMFEIEKAVEVGGHISTTCHPFYQSPSPDQTDPERIEALAEVVRRIEADDRIWAATPREVADWMIEHKSDFPGPATLDPPSYWNPAFYQDIKRDT